MTTNPKTQLLAGSAERALETAWTQPARKEIYNPVADCAPQGPLPPAPQQLDHDPRGGPVPHPTRSALKKAIGAHTADHNRIVAKELARISGARGH